MFGLSLLLSLVGCAASVTAEGIEGGFGSGSTAIWDDNKDMGGGVIILNIGDGCTKYQDMMGALNDYVDYVTEAAMSGEISCKGIEDPLMTYVDAASAFFVKDLSMASFGVTELKEGDYDFPKKASGYVSHYDEAMDLSMYDDFDPDGEYMDNCGLGSQEGEDYEGDSWTLKDGTLTIDSVEDEGKAKGSAEATMVDEKDKDDGAFSATFTASWCDLSL